MSSLYTKSALVLLLAAGAFAADPTNVPSANPKITGFTAPNILSPELIETIVAQGNMKVENPVGVFKYYGYNDDGVLAMIPTTPGSRAELRKTEPDKNLYLVLNNQKGADPLYDYGTHFLFQGHENGVSGYFTRVNLDADGAHRVTLMGSADASGAALPVYDGITWYPFSQRILLTSEGNLGGGVWQATLNVPSTIESLTGILGQGGFEGIQSDEQGRIIIVEDAGGTAGSAGVGNFAKRPNSFIFRFLPVDPSNLKKGGKLQVLQASNNGHTITFTGTPDQHIFSADVAALHTYGLSFNTTWKTIHDTATDGTNPFDANALAKTNGGTPFKRPENGQFRPGTNFGEFIFDETGDTDLRTQAGTTYGGFGGIFRLRLNGDNGILTLVYNGDPTHSSFDNCSFWDNDRIVFVEDAGDTFHAQRTASVAGSGLDSAWMFDLRADYSHGTQPIRILAQGRDASATLDSLFSANAPPGFSGTFNNDGDNEITGWHQSDGDAGINGLLGSKSPKPFENGWRLFYTQQHGENFTWEIIPGDEDCKRNNGNGNCVGSGNGKK